MESSLSTVAFRPPTKRVGTGFKVPVSENRNTPHTSKGTVHAYSLDREPFEAVNFLTEQP